MSYTKTNWANLPSTTTPVNATNLAKIETELETLDTATLNSLMFRGNITNNTNLNNTTDTGIYYIPNITVSNGPAVNYKYTVLIVINIPSGVIQQSIISPSGNTIAIREYSGYPASWGAWRLAYFDEYSTSERIVGRWLDGKPIYKKTITVNNTALGAGSNTVAHGISNLGQVVKLETARVGSQMFPYINLDANNALSTGTFITNIDSTNITIRIFNDSWGTSNIWYFTLFYTKTTD